jgi:uncharacterized protein YecT (DUF1311 family)
MFFISGSAFAYQHSSTDQAFDDSAAAEKNCDGSQLAMNQCEGNIYDHLDQRMNELYRQQMMRLGPDSKAALRDAQRAWIVFRDKTCLYEAGKDARSYMQMVELMCQADMTRRRIEDLNTYLACTSSGCPSD